MTTGPGTGRLSTSEAARKTFDLAQALAERRSSGGYVNVKVSAQGALQPDVNVTPETTQDELDRMTDLAIRSVSRIMAESSTFTRISPAEAGKRAQAPKPEKPKVNAETGEVPF